MKYGSTVLGLTFLMASLANADQLAAFMWQATQGTAMMGQANIIREKIAITIQPDHLDVEHELELNTLSNWGTPEFPNSLEIVGDIVVEKGTVFTSLLLWNGNKILKGKLQTKEMARRKYEDVVDRNVKNPPPPRDPALLEKMGEENYRLSIFPVSLNGSRKIRLRYVIPSDFADSAHCMLFPYPFSEIASVTVQAGDALKGFALNSKFPNGTKKVVKVEDGTSISISLDPLAYSNFRSYSNYFDKPYLHSITPLFGSAKGSRVTLGTTENGLWKSWSKGYAAHFVFDPPVELSEYTSISNSRIVAKIKSEVDSIQKEVAFNKKGFAPHEELRIYSSTPIQKEITWQIYAGDSLVKELLEEPLISMVEDGLQYFRTFGNRTFYPMVKTMPASLAPAWGFIDFKYALLALEQDTLSSALAAKYAKAGVPSLEAEDIFTEEGDLDGLPISAWLMQKNLVLEDLLKPTSVKSHSQLPNGIRWTYRDGAIHIEVDLSMRTRDMSISLYGLDGKKLKQWYSNDLISGSVHWQPKTTGYAQGQALLRITSGANIWSVRVGLR